jgi:hypothetical protein
MRVKAMMLGAMMAGLMLAGGAAMAQTTGAYVVTRGTSTASVTQRVAVMPGLQPNTHVVVRPVLVASAAVDPAVAATPTFPHLVKVVYANTTAVYVDPARAGQIYSSDGIDHLDDNHSLLRAARLGASLRAQGATTVSRTPSAEAEATAPTARPVLRIRKPRPAVAPQPVAMAERR